MNVTSTFLPPKPEPPVVTLTITMTEAEAIDLCEVAYSRIPSRYGNPFILALNQIGIQCPNNYPASSPRDRIF
jgi:hypothetical protein